jgi:hypothetical protein
LDGWVVGFDGAGVGFEDGLDEGVFLFFVCGLCEKGRVGHEDVGDDLKGDGLQGGMTFQEAVKE